MRSQRGLKGFLGKGTDCSPHRGLRGVPIGLELCSGQGVLLLGATGSKQAPLPVEGMAPSRVSVFGFDACALQDLAALLEKPA